MKKLQQSIGQVLDWREAKSGYELWSDKDLMAKIRFQGAIERERSEIIGETADGIWILQLRSGAYLYSQSGITARSVESNVEVATFRSGPSWTRDEGRLEFHDGRIFRWEYSSLLWTEMAFKTEQEIVLARFKTNRSSVMIEPAAATLSELSLMVLFGWCRLHQLPGTADSGE